MEQKERDLTRREQQLLLREKELSLKEKRLACKCLFSCIYGFSSDSYESWISYGWIHLIDLFIIFETLIRMVLGKIKFFCVCYPSHDNVPLAMCTSQ